MGLLIFLIGDCITEKVKNKILDRADELNSEAIRRTGIKLTLVIIGIVLTILSKGATWAVWTAAILFDIVLLWSAFNFVKGAKAGCKVLLYSIANLSLYEGILDYAREMSPEVDFGLSIYSGARKVGQISSFGLITLPKPVEIVKGIVVFLAKKFLGFWLFVQSLAFFLRNGIGNHLLESFTGMTISKICFLPLEPVIRFIPFF